jgi:hypothetical protein
MKKITRIISIFISIIALVSCKNVKIEDDYYYEETEVIDGMKITLKGKGYGVYGQMIEKYKTGTISGLMNGSPMVIRSSSADDNNSSYNEIYLSFEVNGNMDSFETSLDVLKLQGLSQVKVYYTDDEDKEYSLYSKSSGVFENDITVDVQKDVKDLTLCIRAHKYYPSTYSSVNFKGDMTEEEFTEIKGKQVNNEITIKSVKVNK